MKIAFLSIYSGSIDRGVETVVKELGERLSEKHEIHVYQNGDPTGKEKYKVFKIEILPGENWPKDTSGQKIRRKLYLDYYSRKIAVFTLKILPQLVRERYDIIIPLNGGWQVAICSLLRSLHKSKVVISGQAGIGKDDLWNLKWSPDAFIAVTLPMKKWAEKTNSKIRIEQIPNGVDLEKFNPDITPATIPFSHPVVCCNAALVPYKRVDLTIKAVAKVDKASLLLIGDGISKNEIDKLGRSLLDNRYLRLSVSYEEVPRYYKSCDLFTMVSTSQEAFGIVYLEAMATNLPVVATDDAVRHEIVGDAGLFVNPEDIDQYARTLEKAIGINFNSRPRNQAEKFNWDKIAKNYESLFSSLSPR
jgi:glycosyltransferase involved in cell wall biosynthesis